VSRIKKNGTDVEVILDFETDFATFGQISDSGDPCFLEIPVFWRSLFSGNPCFLEIPDLLAYWTIPG
jgi:hypothetical protein